MAVKTRQEMFHVKQNSIKELYISELRAWNRTHRLTGSNDIDLLYSESLQALKSLPSEPSGLIDIGAGSGILGVPALLLPSQPKVCFVEPDIKKASFLLQLKSKVRAIDPVIANNMTIVIKEIQDVSRETIEQLFSGPFIMVARAFSGQYSLKDAVAKSELRNLDVFFFAPTHNNKFVLEKL
jgi:16S rRNA G527 N7-methylase RsmG